MPTLAPKLPWTHPFAGGYPRLGGQPLPTDPDAIDYLERVKAADGGAAVEVGVAMAVDAFVKGCKADGIWDAIKASCLLCGPRTLSGALVPLVGTAPTSYAFASGDYNRVTGLKGDGSTTYLDSGRAGNADGQDDKHLALYVQTPTTADGNFHWYIGDSQTAVVGVWNTDKHYARVNDLGGDTPGSSVLESGVIAASRATSGEISMRLGGSTYPLAVSSTTPSALNHLVFRRNEGIIAGFSDARLAFYSIGSALDLAALDTRVSAYVADIAAAL